MRNITIHSEDDSLIRGKGEKIFEAIGFLCSYGMSGYTTVDIYPVGERDLIACYKTADEKRRFTMGAIWRESEGKYSFHS